MSKMTKDEVKAYIKENGKFPRGWSRCMDCRCTGKGECAGESDADKRHWQQMMNEGMK